MAFIKKKSRLVYSVLIFVVILLFVVAIAGGIYYLHQRRLEGVQTQYEEEIEELKMDLYMLERQVYIPKEDVPCGTILNSALFSCSEMKMETPQEELLEESDMGKVNIVKLKKGIPVTKSMAEEILFSDSVRKLEYNMFLLQTDQSAGDYVDVRIMFPNGENYIVLSKKQMKGVNRSENMVSFWLDEKEIHRISSAIIDTYFYPGTKIYVANYIQPELQKEAIPFYPVNQNVGELIQKDPNLLDKAGDALTQEARRLLESHIDAMAEEERSRITSGVKTEITKTNELIQKNEKENSTNQYEEQEIGEANLNKETKEPLDESMTGSFQ